MVDVSNQSDSIVKKILRSEMKGVQEKHQSWVWGIERKITRDARQWSSGRFFLSTPHNYDRSL